MPVTVAATVQVRSQTMYRMRFSWDIGYLLRGFLGSEMLYSAAKQEFSCIILTANMIHFDTTERFYAPLNALRHHSASLSGSLL